MLGLKPGTRPKGGVSALTVGKILRNDAYLYVRRSDPATAGQAQDAA